jgi:hypothetical protein
VSTQDSLAERYGAPSAARRSVLVIATVVCALMFLGWLTWTVAGHTSAEVTSELEGYSIIDDSTVSAVLVVSLADDDVEASCRLRALAEDHNTVGELAFTPDPEAGDRQVVEIRTERRAAVVESLGCTAEGQKTPR